MPKKMIIRIILAEDNDIIRENLLEIISTDAEIEVAGYGASGVEIIKIARSVDFDIALLDIGMETATAGIFAAVEIIAVKPDVKVIFLTVYEDDKTVFQAMETGAVDYIIKSENAEKIIEHIKKAYMNTAEIEYKVQNKMRAEFLRLRKTETNLLYYIKNIAILTPAEKTLIKLLLEGKNIREIAENRFVELTTVKTQIGKILKKFGARRTREITEQIRKMNLQNLFDTLPS